MSSSLEFGILGFATCPGELELSAAQIAEGCGATAAAIDRSLGGQRVFVTRGPAWALGLDAARRALEQAGVVAAALDAIVWCGTEKDSLQVQHELGATRAFTLAIDGHCAELTSAMRVACGLLGSGSAHVLVGCSEKNATRHSGTTPTERNYRQIFCDAGGAALLGRSSRLRIAGFGFATQGRYFDYWEREARFRRGELPEGDLPDDSAVYYDAVETRGLAVERCLADARIDLAAVDHLMVPTRVAALALSTARLVGLSPDRLIVPRVAHMGRADILFDLARLLEAGDAVSAHHALFITSTIGVFRCVALRI